MDAALAASSWGEVVATQLSTDNCELDACPRPCRSESDELLYFCHRHPIGRRPIRRVIDKKKRVPVAEFARIQAIAASCRMLRIFHSRAAAAEFGRGCQPTEYMLGDYS